MADDHPIVAEGIKHLLENDFELLEIVVDGSAIVDAIHRHKPHLVISDINMPGCNGLDALKQIRAEGGRVPFIFLTMHAEPALATSAMNAGANGYVLKYSAGEDLTTAVHEVLLGRTYVTSSLGARFISRQMYDFNSLTAKQREVLRLVVQGLRSKQIAVDLGVSVRTVEAHKYNMMQMLGVHSALELVRRSEELGLQF